MRVLSIALMTAVFIAGSAVAAPKKKNESPPTAKPDSTLVLPDTTPPPPITGAPTHPVEMQPIGAVGTAIPAPQPVLILAQAAPAPATPPPAAPPPLPEVTPPPLPAVLARAEQCLRAEAPRAARADASTKFAVDLLLQDLCAAEVERASLYAHNLDGLARFTPQSERTAAGLNGARVDPETGEIVNPPAGDVSGALAAAGFNPGDLTVPPQVRRFAAELVLEAKSAAEPARKSR